MNETDLKSVNAIRILSADMIQKANSGHPGMPLGAAPIAYELWTRHMCHNPKNPTWVNRDRFVLSSGHASALLYSLLHLFGYGLTTEDLMNFRQVGALTPGHPEYGHTAGVDATTGPLGAGIGMAVGMAMAEKRLSTIFNKGQFRLFDHYTYALAGDGCFMEGISSEAMSLAGTLGLGKLIIFYDSNNITIEGSTDLAFTENVGARAAAQGFQVVEVEDANDLSAIAAAINEAKQETEKPSLIICHTTIGYGCEAKAGKSSAHGEPLGEENVASLREALGWEIKTPFGVPEDVYHYIQGFAMRGEQAEAAWNDMAREYFNVYPEMAEKWDEFFTKDYGESLLYDDRYWQVDDKDIATRAASGNMIQKLADRAPSLIGGSADLGPSNKTVIKDGGEFSKEDYSGRNIHFGVRELAMGAITNGLYLHGGVRPYAATFFVFSDYIRPMIRLAALMKIPTTYVMTHDSIGVGEDGPTHQPIEHLASFRAMPNVNVIRPADAGETAAAWYLAMASKETPTMLVLSRQNLPSVYADGHKALKGGYIINDSSKVIPDAILIATGSEVSLAIEAKRTLKTEGIDVRVVSMPCMEIFEQQSEEYKESVLPKDVTARVAIEAGTSFGWERYIGSQGKMVSIDHFGESGPAKELFAKFGFTKDNVIETVKSVIG